MPPSSTVAELLPHMYMWGKERERESEKRLSLAAAAAAAALVVVAPDFFFQKRNQISNF